MNTKPMTNEQMREIREHVEQHHIGDTFARRLLKHIDHLERVIAALLADSQVQQTKAQRDQVDRLTAENTRLAAADQHLSVAKQRLGKLVGKGNNLLPLISRVEAAFQRLTAENARLREALHRLKVEVHLMHPAMHGQTVVETCQHSTCQRFDAALSLLPPPPEESK